MNQKVTRRFSSLLVAGVLALHACAEGPTDPSPRLSERNPGPQQLIALNTDDFASSPAGGSVLAPGLRATVLASATPLRVAGIGANSGNRAANIIFSSGDLAGSITRLTATQFNALTVQQLRDSYDVLLFTWASGSTVNADWNTRLLPYMQLGGGIIWEDNTNLADLAAAVSASAFDSFGTMTVIPVAGLTDGINGTFDNTHIRFTSWIPALAPFLTLAGTTQGLYGQFGGGRIVLTGPDQDFHAFRSNNAYKLLINELKWVSSGTPPNTGPTITAPADLSFDNDAGVCQATVAVLGVATVVDDGEYVVGPPTRSDGAAIDAPYPVGTTTVTWTVTDAGGLSDSDEQTVTVNDAEAPIVTAPADITVATDAGQPYATVDPAAATASDNCAGVTVNDPPSGTYPIGTTTVTYTATDAAGLSASATLDITVQDLEAPTLTLPPSFTVNATMPGGAVVNFVTSTTDNSGSSSVECSPASGSTYAIGNTVTSCTASDDYGNSTTATFTVTVLGARAQIEDLIAQVTALSLHNGTSQPLLSMLATALRDPGATAPEVACIKLDDFIFKLQDHKSVASIPQVIIDEMIADSQRIQSVLGCP